MRPPLVRALYNLRMKKVRARVRVRGGCRHRTRSPNTHTHTQATHGREPRQRLTAFQWIARPVRRGVRDATRPLALFPKIALA